MLTSFTPRLDVLPATQREIWPLLKSVPRRFVLYGGTAIALRLGHRQSVDFDFFTTDSFQVEALMEEIPWLNSAKRLQSKTNTLTVAFGKKDPVKLSFFGGLTIGRVGEPQLTDDGTMCVASLLDLAATKMAVIQQRAERKDYRDVAQLLNAGIGLPEALGAARALYRDTFNPMITLKALSYFRDGDLPTLPSEIQLLLSDAAKRVTTIPPIPRAAEVIAL